MLELILVTGVETLARALEAEFSDVHWLVATGKAAAATSPAQTLLDRDGAVLDLESTSEHLGWKIARAFDGPVLILVDDARPELVISAQQHGVELSYTSHWKTAVDAFRRRLQGSARFRVKQVAADHGLTAQERRVLDLFAGGFDRQAISAELQIAKRTVRAHLASIRDKCGAPSSAHLRELVRCRQPCP